MVIYDTEQVSQGCFKISSDAGLAFFIRCEYLKLVEPSQIVSGAVFEDENEADIVDAGLSFACETKAMDYISRAEQSRFGLTQKLINKKYEKKHIAAALDFLEQKQYLCDSRFALCWLNSRKINHFEGKTRLLAELSARGISKEDSQKAVAEFFMENSEEDFCLGAINKLYRLGYEKNDKLYSSLMQKGFSYAMIKKMLPLSEYASEKGSHNDD